MCEAFSEDQADAALRTQESLERQLLACWVLDMQACYEDQAPAASAAVIAEYLESELELLGLTGVEDKLQDDVKLTLELLRNAGLKCWILTGDKMETATSKYAYGCCTWDARG